MELFWRDGYAATGLDRLVRRTRASRYGLYATFGGKRDLFLATLERYSQTVMDPMLAPLEQARASVPEIRAFFDRVLEVIRQSGAGRTADGCAGPRRLASLDHDALVRRVGLGGDLGRHGGLLGSLTPRHHPPGGSRPAHAGRAA